MIILVFGASGAAGGSVLKAALEAPDISQVRVIVRRPGGSEDLFLSISPYTESQSIGMPASEATCFAVPTFRPSCLPIFCAVRESNAQC